MHTNLKALLNDPSHIRGAGLQVKLNGKNSTLLLDTGSSGILVDRKIAEKAGLKRIVETHIRGVGDKEAASGYVAQADKIQIGDLEFDDCMVEVMDRNSVLDDDGLIGADVFSSFLVDVNLPDWKFSLSPLPRRPDEKSAETPALASGRSNHAPQFHNRYIAPEMKDYTPIFRFGHQLLMPTAVNGAALKLFLLDTGAFGNAINPATAREFSKVSRDDDMKIKGLSGRVNDVFRAREVTLTFAHMRQKNQDLVSFDTTSLSNSTGTEVSGFLGFSLLAMLDMKIDYRDGLVDFTFDSNRYCRMNCN
jgi:predicted aspartyl protease